MIIRGYHIRWAFWACLVGLVGYVAYRQYYLATPSGRLATYLEFVRSADRVEFFTTTDPWLGDSSRQIQTSPDLFPIYRRYHSELRKAASSRERDQLYRVLSNSIESHSTFLSSFDPHQFVVAEKGETKVELAISFSQGLIHCQGGLPPVSTAIREVDPAMVSAIFGLDISPQLRRIQSEIETSKQN